MEVIRQGTQGGEGTVRGGRGLRVGAGHNKGQEQEGQDHNKEARSSSQVTEKVGNQGEGEGTVRTEEDSMRGR